MSDLERFVNPSFPKLIPKISWTNSCGFQNARIYISTAKKSKVSLKKKYIKYNKIKKKKRKKQNPFDNFHIVRIISAARSKPAAKDLITTGHKTPNFFLLPFPSAFGIGAMCLWLRREHFSFVHMNIIAMVDFGFRPKRFAHTEE